MPGLMNFLEPFATGYLETKIAGQEKRAEYIQKQNELSDAKLAAIAKARAIKLNDLEIENDNLEAIRAKEEENLLKQHSDMNPTVLKYLQDQNYFYDKAAWTAFSAEFKKQGGGSDKWYQQLVIGGGNRSWEDMVAERIDNAFNKEDAKNTSDLADNTKNLLLDFSVENQPFSLWNAKSINPIAIQEWKKSTQELKAGKLDFDIKKLTHDITKETKDDTIALLSANLSGKELSNEHQTIINNIAEKTQSSEISIRNTFEKLQETKLKMVTWDYVNQATIGGLDINIKRQNEELNKLAIEAAVYDAETQPAKDLIDNNLKQADLLFKNISNSSLRQKNTLTIKQLQTNISNVEQGMSIAEASKDSNLQKLKYQVDNLKIENEMKTLMLENQPQETVLRLQGLQLDNISKQYKNLTATEIDRATLENIRQRNIQLEKNIGSFDENQKTDLKEQNLKIEKLQKEIDEAPKVTLLKQGEVTKSIESGLGDAIGAPSSTTGEGPLQTITWNWTLMDAPWISTDKVDVISEGTKKVQEYQNLIKTNPDYKNIDVRQINMDNISRRILGEKLQFRFANDQAKIKNIIQDNFKTRGVVMTPDMKIKLKPIVEKIMNNPKYDATADLAKFGIDINVYKTFWTRADGTVSNSSYWNESMISTINKFKNGDYSEQYDILGIK
tara:strand:- start:4131 stop:6143 length:2013 start_codon:yes stop_codon:yes gene_type:complete